jgi:hypothetical protein
VYKTEGCTHVDGFLCNMPTCTILENHLEKKISGYRMSNDSFPVGKSTEEKRFRNK